MKLKLPFLKVVYLGLLFALDTICEEDTEVAPGYVAIPHQNSSILSAASSSASSLGIPSTPVVSSTPMPVMKSTTVEPTLSSSALPSTSNICGSSLVSVNVDISLKLQQCRCSTWDEDGDIDCSYLNMSALPKSMSFLKSARRVSFYRNQIEEVADDTFLIGRYVIELNLSHNHIGYVSSVAFKAFENLRKLDLSWNKISNISSMSFQSMSKLVILDLGNNNIDSLSPGVFKQTPELKFLTLKSNPLKELKPKLFEHLPNLEVLDLESTLLKVIPDHLFYFTPQLKLLELPNNRLASVPTEALRVLDHLKLLDLSGNPIPTIGQEAFLGLENLVVLYLDRMPVLTTVEKYSFGDVQKLQELHCSSNIMLKRFDGGAFVNRNDGSRVNISELSLKNNSLESLPEDLLNWSDSIELHISNNPLHCDCNVEWLVKVKLKNDFQTHAKCFSPSSLSDKTIIELEGHKLSCGLELSELVMRVVAIVLAVIVIVLIIAYLFWTYACSSDSKTYTMTPKKAVTDYGSSIQLETWTEDYAS